MITISEHGALVVREDDNVYTVHDANRKLGHIVRHIRYDGQKLFRAFGEDFFSLSDAVKEFTKIAGFRARSL